ncbi:glycoside hydrolase family 16 protein [Labilibaculum sp. K2S]|uniref:glycoside hydrolase family 16 protein n=1 Tax=Labilibaculum sp. K2S TaxID=3056386 RepID=UPI0025A322AB|nr:glycoside hydrolase family 16 protein [Labilibaculum sp. K2S]MDM8158477.1 glycoside hydrolase family 16 protein [Labilibaculum sp. K2S]
MTLKNTILLLGTIFLLSSCKWKKPESSVKNTESALKSDYQLVWSDEFNYTGLPDSTKWSYDTEGNSEGWGNSEAQHYTIAKKENAWVENGVLNIIALKEQYEGKDYTSARLNSKANWLYGKIEVNAKLPKGRGTWSAIWMMPKDWSFKDGDWPNIGEIDIMEHVGHNLGAIHASAHSKDYQWQTNTQQTDTIHIADVAEKFHSYIWEWTPEVMRAYVDDQLYFEYKNEGLGVSKWPYIKPFYLILNVAVGGVWGSVEGIDAEAFPQTMQVEYVRIYQKK